MVRGFFYYSFGRNDAHLLATCTYVLSVSVPYQKRHSSRSETSSSSPDASDDGRGLVRRLDFVVLFGRANEASVSGY